MRKNGGEMSEILARGETHDWVIEALSREPRGRLLDAPAGTGSLAERAKKIGFSVTCCDIDPSLFSVSGMEVEKADLNEPLPYASETFDVVTCLEGLEHLENPFNALREFARVLRRGGKLFLSLPNYLNIERRLRFLITGLFSKVPSPQRYGKERFESLTMLHLLPLTYPVLKLVLEHYGFRVVAIEKDKEKKRMKWLLPLVWAIRLYCFFWPKRKREDYHLEETLSAPLIMGGNTLILVCRKEG